MRSSSMRRLAAVAVVVLLAAVSVLVWKVGVGVRQPAARSAAEIAVTQGGFGGPFVLTGARGQTVHSADLQRWQLIYFGYTRCPDVCPTTLQTIALALRALGPPAAGVSPVFITVDPVHDTPAAIGRYTALFDPRIVGLTGTEAQLHAVEQSFRVYAAPAADGTSVDHSSYIYLMGPGETLRALFDRNVTAPQLAAAITRQMG